VGLVSRPRIPRSDLHPDVDYLVHWGISENVAKRILKYRPNWISHFRKKSKDHKLNTGNVVWYRGLDINSMSEYDPRNLSAGEYGSVGELWIATEWISTLAIIKT